MCSLHVASLNWFTLGFYVIATLLNAPSHGHQAPYTFFSAFMKASHLLLELISNSSKEAGPKAHLQKFVAVLYASCEQWELKLKKQCHLP